MMNEKNWFLVQFKPNNHIIAEQNLRAQNYKTFLPLEEKILTRYGRKTTVITPLFPGYLFVSFSLTYDKWSVINSTFGVSKLLSQNNKPQIIPQKIMDELIDRCDESGKLLPPKNIKSGDKVIVINSAFSKFVSTIDLIDSKNRIWILMDILGRGTRVEIKPNQIQNY
jgi:transcriptional antiterminator RfaH